MNPCSPNILEKPATFINSTSSQSLCSPSQALKILHTGCVHKQLADIFMSKHKASCKVQKEGNT